MRLYIWEGQTEWKVYLPEDEWVHLWTRKKSFAGGDVTVEAPDRTYSCFPTGKTAHMPPLFEAIRKKYGE